MSDRKLETFKIGDTRKPSVSAPKKAAPEQPPAASPSLGFKRIEGILERETPEAVRANLATLRGDLEAFEKGARAAKDRGAAKKAMLAVDRTADLMDFLFKTKESLARGEGG